ncbi:MAG: serine hydrolase [Verrucomicrobia bacterium]|nr:serine hydrolase [Verrucomicrobiota bacterium]
MIFRFEICMLALVLLTSCGRDDKTSAARLPDVFPASKWRHKNPALLGMDQARLESLARLVGGAGVVVRHGYMVHRWGRQTPDQRLWSAAKPVISTFLMFAVQEKLLRDVDRPLAEIEPRLRTINGGKDAAITWRHLASQTSGYGLVEKPGEAFAYNDFAIAFYYDSLMGGVFRSDATEVLRRRIAEPLDFEDAYSFEKESVDAVSGSLQMSVRDFARFGYFVMRHGKWNGKQLLPPQLIDQMLTEGVPATLPMSSGKEADMLPGQRSYGTSMTRNDTPVGPGFYSFNWWLNLEDAQGRRPVPDAPSDSIFAVGLFGRAVLWIIPSLDVIVSWNQSDITDHLESIRNDKSKFNTAAKLIRESVIDIDK